MTPTLLLWLSLTGSFTGERLSELRHLANEARVRRALQSWLAEGRGSSPFHFDFDKEQDGPRQVQLALVRRARAIKEEHIAWLERMMLSRPDLFPPEIAERTRLQIQDMKKDVEKRKKQERELWEQQPGGITAPAPREKK